MTLAKTGLTMSGKLKRVKAAGWAPQFENAVPECRDHLLTSRALLFAF